MEITIPRLGWSMDEGTFGEWLKSDGDFVEAGDALFTLESEKALQEVESIDEGYLHIVPDGPQEGDTVTVGALLGWLLAEGQSPPTVQPQNNPNASEAIPAQQSSIETESIATSFANDRRQTPTISPRAARVARELGVDWTKLVGSGRTGRIRECDVRAVSTSQPASLSATPLGNLRRTIAKRMLESARTTAPVTLTSRVDATNLVALREQFKASSQNGPTPAYHDIIAKLVALALEQHPVMNSRWTDEGVVQPEGVHIGLAVDTADGLVVPVIPHVGRLTLRELAAQSRALIERAKNRTCSAADLRDGTFTITNLGSLGIDAFTPIINTPETAILGLGAIRREAVVLAENRIEPRDRLTLSLTFDHRVTDGAPAARFLQHLCEGIENPAPWLMG